MRIVCSATTPWSSATSAVELAEQRERESSMKGFGVLKRMSVVRAISLGYIVLIVLFIAAAAVAAFAINEVRTSAADIRTEREAIISRAADLKVAVNREVSVLRAEVLAKSMGGGTIEDVDAAQQATKSAVTELKKTSLDADGQKKLAVAEKDIAIFNETVDKVVGLARAGRVQEAVDLTESDAGPLAQLLDQELKGLSEAVTTSLEAELAKSEDRVDTIVTVAFVAVGACIVLAILLAIFIPRSISKQLRSMIANLGTSTAEMLAVTSQVAAGAVQTATAISEAATTVDEVRQTSLLASQKATAVSDNAQAADQVAEGGRQAVSATLEGIRRIQEQMSVVGDSVVRLSEQTEAVSDIIATSNDIAEQSNLLSVNAAIEAAKASEQGKGFSVVAEEIKNLAQQSKQGVMQVRSILNDIQRATSAAVMAAEQSGKAIEDGASQALESSQAIESLAESVAAAAQSAMQIVASAQQQLVGMDQISEAMASIDQASAQNAAGAKQMETEVHHLRELAYTLQSMIDAKAGKELAAIQEAEQDEAAFLE
jgi:methyl-accepting chemotaxis protein